MATSKEPAAAGSKRTSKIKTIDSVTLTKIRNGKVENPAIVFDGDAPEKGEKVRFMLANKVTYQGAVTDVTEADGNVLVEFGKGIQPVTK